MNCHDATNLANARLHGELPPGAAADLEGHLAGCPACRDAAEEVAQQDAALRRAAAPARRAAAALAERVIAELPAPAAPARRRWLAMALATAAGFALACVIFQPWRRAPRLVVVVAPPSATPATRPSVARLNLATGAVFLCPAGAADWAPMPTGGAVPAGSRVRTDVDVRCELATADGSAVRLNAATEVRFDAARRVEVTAGEVWSTVAKAADPFEARAARGTFTALGTQFDLLARDGRATLMVADGSVRVAGDTVAADAQVVGAGQTLTVAPDGRLGSATAAGNLAIATRWVNEILVLKGRDDPELAKRVDDLFAQLGNTKMSYLGADEIRGLGDHAVVPLCRYVESDRSAHDPAGRARAAEIVADVAPTWAIPELIRLLDDRAGEVRYWAAVALRRLTAETLDRTPEQWRDDPPMTCQPTADRWRQWWARHRDRYPGSARLPATVPAEPS